MIHPSLSFWIALFAVVSIPARGVAGPGGQKPGATIVNVPDPDMGAQTLAERKAAQMATKKNFKAFVDFKFQDRRPESGIGFVQHTVDDIGKDFKAVHYDHGNGIVAADVDGDGLEDIYFISQLGGNELYKNLGHGRFKNITKEAGVAVPDRVGVTATFVDIDNDGAPDLYVTTVRGGNVLFHNDGKGHFQDITKEAGVGHVGHSSGAVFFDYDNDGLVDLFLTNVGRYTTDKQGRGGYYIGFNDAFQGVRYPERTEYSILYKNLDGKHFKDVSKETGLISGSWTGDASACDINHDGYPDIYVMNMHGNNHLYINHGGKTFTDEISKYFPKTPPGAMGIKFFDYDNDGLMDLYLTDMHSDMIGREVDPKDEKQKFIKPVDNHVFGNAFYHNLGNGKFEEISDRIGVENFWPWGPSIADLNADGFEDIFIAASMSFPFRYGINSVLLNNQGEKFMDSEFILGVEPRRGGATREPWFDLDCSGADKGHKYCEGKQGKVTVTGTLGTRAAVIFDLDNDGDLDIVTNEMNARPQVLISDLTDHKKIHFLKIDLLGKKSNRNGLGAWVRVTAGGKAYLKYNDGKSGYLSQSLLPLYYGLGEAQTVDKVEVEWPSGKRQVVTEGLKANTRIKITEPN